MNLLLKALLIRRSKEQGFVIPLVMALGLIMTLIGLIDIFKSSDENVNAISQRDAQRALSAAEAGVAYYRDLIDKNKTIAVYNSEGGTVNWINNTNIPAINNNCGFPNQGATAVSTIATNASNDVWEPVNGNSDLGEFRLASYSYTSPNIGNIVVEGRDRDSDDAAAIEVSVDFPIQLGLFPSDFPNNITDRVTENLNNLNPTLWVNSNALALDDDDLRLDGGNSNLNVTGNILISKTDCALSGSVKERVEALKNGSAIPRPMPAIPTQPTSITTITNNNDIINKTLPRSGDIYRVEKGKNVYYYLIQNPLTLSDTEKILITSGAKVVFYLQNNLTLNGNVDLNFDDTNNSDNLQIFGKSTTSIIEFKGTGTINIKALIHAPNAKVITSDFPTVNINGAVWVDKWDTNIGTITIASDNRYFYYNNLQTLVTQLGAINPIIYPPTNWQTQEVD